MLAVLELDTIVPLMPRLLRLEYPGTVHHVVNREDRSICGARV